MDAARARLTQEAEVPCLGLLDGGERDRNVERERIAYAEQRGRVRYAATLEIALQTREVTARGPTL